MTDQSSGVVAGVDAHTDEHHVAVLDEQGRLLATAAFPTTGAGYAELLGWLRGHGRIARVGVESTGAYAAGLVRALLANGISAVVGVFFGLMFGGSRGRWVDVVFGKEGRRESEHEGIRPAITHWWPSKCGGGF